MSTSFVSGTGRELAADRVSEEGKGICFYFHYTSREAEHTESLKGGKAGKFDEGRDGNEDVDMRVTDVKIVNEILSSVDLLKRY